MVLVKNMSTNKNQERGVFSSQIVQEGEDRTLRIDCSKCTFLPSIEDNPLVMSKTIELLVENKTVTKIVFYQQRDFVYEFEQTRMLMQIAGVYDKLVREKNLLGHQKLGFSQGYTKGFNQRFAEIHNINYNLVKSDPIGAYVELKRLLRREKSALEAEMDPIYAQSLERYIALLESVIDMLGDITIIKLAKPYLAGYHPGDRSIYGRIINPVIKPDFMFTRLMAKYPAEAEELATYTFGNSEVMIFRLPGSIQYLYHLIPPEFQLSEEKYEILDTARSIIAEHKPKKSEFIDPERMRAVFYNVGKDLIEELVTSRKLSLRSKEIDELTRILVRYTVGFGLIEVLLSDPKVQDITINSPMGRTPIFIVHQDFDDCVTNIIPSRPEADSWASKLRMISGRPLDEANPILDTELELPKARARVAVISPPLNPSGLAFALRRHRDKPWTLPLFMHNGMVSPLAAGVLSFIIDGSRTMLVAGTRSAGKTSLLGSLMIGEHTQ